MSETILFTGGARSGKSRLAQEWCRKRDMPRWYVATANPDHSDGEMDERIRRHQDERQHEWTGTIEEPLALARVLEQAQAAAYGVVLIDCLTLWLSNICMQNNWAETAIMTDIDNLVAVIAEYSGNLALVSNEVGLGIVPMGTETRLYRDAHGIMNQRIAAVTDSAIFCSCGLPLVLKGQYL